ncbi:glycoside hydrolase family 19 protein [Dyadobacter sediminis]|uniref:Glycoside hydrolase family 19 protein n=1 Tax=Dyadobacter sediminis TaxID=1493691 RepID=A0A5R9KBS9_9BACT|nr:glycoside hydrolase family 19 protein [Dyadobacter sediminis]TLU92218.1 glycoside hydrolase family 19 protein [Dyadobacter sediminis]GGB96454.1 glycoside hydrolase [Dyadobacter sediminis]
MTSTQLQAVACSTAASAMIFLPYINATFDRYAIHTPQRQLCFMAQVAHESGGLFYTEELASGAAYEGRQALGNTQPGDGVKFKGRGLIQITGRNNYQLLSEAFNVDFVSNPQLLGGKNITLCSPDQLKYAALSAGWFWDRAKLNGFADKINPKQPIDSGANLEYFKRITKGVNGAYNGLPDRLHRYMQGAAVLSPLSSNVQITTL